MAEDRLDRSLRVMRKTAQQLHGVAEALKRATAQKRLELAKRQKQLGEEVNPETVKILFDTLKISSDEMAASLLNLYDKQFNAPTMRAVREKLQQKG